MSRRSLTAVSALVACGLTAAVFGGYAWGRGDRRGATVTGGSPRRLTRSDGSPIDSEQARRLASLAYVAGSQPAKDDVGIVTRTDQALDGANFYVSGHAPEARLIDMDGHTLHHWRFEYERAFPGTSLPTTPIGRGFWRRALLLPDGDVIAIYEGQGLIRIDAQSNLRWAAPIGAHHDLFRAPSGEFWTLSRKVQLIPQINADEPVLEDFVTVLSDRGKVLREISILEALWRSEYKALLDAAPSSGDLLHTNTLVRLTGELAPEIPAFAAGNLLLSLPRINALVVLDPVREEIVWAMSGLFRFQHTPALVGGHRLLLLDNQWRPDQSRAIELDVLTQQVVWRFDGTPERPFYTEFNGAAYRLENGDTLMIESDGGRAIEVDPLGATVWEFRSPHRTADGLVAALFDLRRIDPKTLRFPYQAKR